MLSFDQVIEYKTENQTLNRILHKLKVRKYYASLSHEVSHKAFADVSVSILIRPGESL